MPTLYERIRNEIVNPNSDLRSRIPADIASKVASFTGKFVNTKMPPNSQKWLNTHADSILTGITIKRAPVSRAITGFLNALSGGRLNAKARQMGFDNLFHLSVVINFEDDKGKFGEAQLEKLERVSFSSHISESPNTERFELQRVRPEQTIGEIVKRMISNMGDDFYKYDSFKNNCQSFILGFLRAAHALDPAVEKFVNQNASELLKAQPGYLGQLANSITNLGAIVNQVMQGGAMDEKTYIKVANTPANRKKFKDFHKYKVSKDSPDLIVSNFEFPRNWKTSMMKGSGVFSSVKDAILGQLDKNSFTRNKLVPVAVDLATFAQPFLDVYAPGSGTAIKSIAKGINCANEVAKAVGYGNMHGGNARPWVQYLLDAIVEYKKQPYDTPEGVLNGILNSVIKKYDLIDSSMYKKGIPSQLDEMIHYVDEFIKRRKALPDGKLKNGKVNVNYVENLDVLKLALERFYTMANRDAYGVIKAEKVAKKPAAPGGSESADDSKFDKAVEEYEEANRNAAYFREHGVEYPGTQAPPPKTAAEKAADLKARFEAIKKGKKN